MGQVTILVTYPTGAEFDDFVHGDTIFSFVPITSKGPRKLIEGQVWAFVDWVMPDMAGLEMCRRIRADERMEDAHITMILEREDLEDGRRAIRAGADDFMVGPVDRQGILDRVLALQSGLIGRSSRQVIERGELCVDIGAEQARWRGRPVPLRPNEFRLLRFLAENPNQVHSRQDLIEALHKQGNPDYLRTVDVWIKRLRFGLREVEAGHILRTVHAKGYVLDLP